MWSQLISWTLNHPFYRSVWIHIELTFPCKSNISYQPELLKTLETWISWEWSEDNDLVFALCLVAFILFHRRYEYQIFWINSSRDLWLEWFDKQCIALSCWFYFQALDFNVIFARKHLVKLETSERINPQFTKVSAHLSELYHVDWYLYCSFNSHCFWAFIPESSVFPPSNCVYVPFEINSHISFQLCCPDRANRYPRIWLSKQVEPKFHLWCFTTS